MKPPHREAVKIANAIIDQLTCLNKQSVDDVSAQLSRLNNAFNHLQTLQRKLEMCKQRHLLGAVRGVQ